MDTESAVSPVNAGEMVILDVDTVRAFFSFLSPDPKEIFTVAFLTDEPKGNVPGYGTYNGTVDDIIKTTQKLQSEHGGYSGVNVSLHVTLNRTNLLGRRTAHIESARVLAVDLDGVGQAELDAALACSPYGIVESSEPGSGKFHLYWKLLDEALTLREWSRFQLALGSRFGGDLGLDHVTKTLRVPGVARKTKSGTIWMPTFRCTVNYEQFGPIGTLEFGIHKDHLSRWFPWVNEEYEKALISRKALQKEQGKMAQQFIEGQTPKRIKDISAGGRNNFIYDTVKKRVMRFTPGTKRMSEDACAAFGFSINQAFAEPLDERELSQVLRSAFEHGARVWEKRHERYERRVSQLDEEKVEEKMEEKSMEIPIVEAGEAQINGNGHNSVHDNVHANDSVDLQHFGGFKYDESDPLVVGASAFTDYGLAARVTQQFGNSLLKTGGVVSAFDSDSLSWKPQGDRHAEELSGMVSRVVLELRDDEQFIAQLCTDQDGYSDRLFGKALKQYQSTKKLNDIVALVHKSKRIKQVGPEIFDANPDVFHCSNGLVDLVSGQIRAPRAEDYLTCRSGVSYDSKATCEGWKTFLGEIFEDNEPLIDFMQEVFGYSLQGSIREQILFCHYGLGANGKSRLLRALQALTGDYATTLAPDDISFTNDKIGAKPFERVAAKIEGHRVVILDDLEVAQKWSEATVKNLTTERVRARAEYQQSREIINRAKVHLGLNVAPKPQAENHGLLRRLCFIPYLRRFEGGSSEMIRIDSMVDQELSGILNWAIEGYRRWKGRGKLMLPEACLQAISEYKQENFSMESLILEMWEKTEDLQRGNFHPTSKLLEAFNQKLAELGGKPTTAIILGRHLRAVLGAEASRIRIEGHEVRGFYLKAKYTDFNLLGDKLEGL